MAPRRMLVAGVGYRNLRDLSVGPVLVERLRDRTWPAWVELHDMSYGAIAALHWFRENSGVDKAVFLTGAERGQPPGTLRRYAWHGRPAEPEEVQARVAEAVTGVIGVDTLLTVVGHFGGLPPEVIVIEVEPGDGGWGPELSRPVAAALEAVEEMVWREVMGVVA